MLHALLYAHAVGMYNLRSAQNDRKQQNKIHTKERKRKEFMHIACNIHGFYISLHWIFFASDVCSGIVEQRRHV